MDTINIFTKCLINDAKLLIIFAVQSIRNSSYYQFLMVQAFNKTIINVVMPKYVAKFAT